MLLVCENAFNLTFHPIYRTSQYYSLIILLLAIPPLTYFIFWKLISCAFHGNLKWVMTGYFASVLIFDLFYVWISLYHTFSPFFATDHCDLFINQNLYATTHVTAIALMCIPMFFPFAIFVERLYATKSAESYEKTSTFLGPVLSVITVLIDVALVVFLYKDEEFLEPSISFAFIPSPTAPRMFTFYWVLFFLNILNFCLNLLLLRENRRLKKQIVAPLGVRYQLEEVYLSTKFAVIVIFTHILFFGCFVATVIFVRYYGSFLISDPTTVTAIRGASISMIATYNFIIGITAVYLNKRIQNKKIGEIRENVRIPATGTDGAANYENAIFSVWNSMSSMTRRATQ